MKGTLTFNLTDNDERDQFELAAKAQDLHLALWDIRQQIFRPARKHGYEDREIQAYFEPDSPKGNEPSHATAHDLVEAFEKMFNEILNKYSIPGEV